MKRILSFILAFVALASIANAQSAFYIKFSGGYAFPLSSYNMGENSKQTYLKTRDPDTGNYVPAFINESSEVKGSHGTGISISGTVGYNFTDVISAEISANYIHGKEYKTTAQTQDITDDRPVGGDRSITNNYLTTNKSASDILLVAPSLRLTAPNGLLRPYVSAGPVLGFANIEHEYNGFTPFDNSSNARHEKFSGGVSIGMRGAIGLDIRLSKSLAVFSEAVFNGISYYPREREVTKYAVNDVDQLSTMSERDKRTVYVKNILTDTRSEGNGNADKPNKAIRISFQMSSLVANVGLKIVL